MNSNWLVLFLVIFAWFYKLQNDNNFFNGLFSRSKQDEEGTSIWKKKKVRESAEDNDNDHSEDNSKSKLNPAFEELDPISCTDEDLAEYESQDDVLFIYSRYDDIGCWNTSSTPPCKEDPSKPTYLAKMCTDEALAKCKANKNERFSVCGLIKTGHASYPFRNFKSMCEYCSYQVNKMDKEKFYLERPCPELWEDPEEFFECD